MNTAKGDLLKMADDGKFDIIVHGANCFHKMGSGIAKQIAAKYPAAKEADDCTVKGDRGKLGNFSQTTVNLENGNSFLIINAYTQYKWSGYRDVFEYKAFDTFLNRLCPFVAQLREVKGDKVKIGFPMIGCGYARGDRNRIVPMIEKFSEDVENWGLVTLVTYGD
jgi:O-acetyl-ADP-ribose deacetylase (regulator of RNase III)